MITFVRWNIIVVGEEGDRWNLTVDMEAKTVQHHHLSGPEEMSPDVRDIVKAWEKFTKGKGFTNLGVEHPKDAVKCVVPF